MKHDFKYYKKFYFFMKGCKTMMLDVISKKAKHSAFPKSKRKYLKSH